MLAKKKMQYNTLMQTKVIKIYTFCMKLYRVVSTKQGHDTTTNRYKHNISSHNETICSGSFIAL